MNGGGGEPGEPVGGGLGEPLGPAARQNKYAINNRNVATVEWSPERVQS